MSLSSVNGVVSRDAYSSGTVPTVVNSLSIENVRATPERAIGAYRSGSAAPRPNGLEVMARGLGIVPLAATSASVSLPVLTT